MLNKKQHKEFKIITFILVGAFCVVAILLKIFLRQNNLKTNKIWNFGN